MGSWLGTETATFLAETRANPLHCLMKKRALASQDKEARYRFLSETRDTIEVSGIPSAPSDEVHCTQLFQACSSIPGACTAGECSTANALQLLDLEFQSTTANLLHDKSSEDADKEFGCVKSDAGAYEDCVPVRTFVVVPARPGAGVHILQLSSSKRGSRAC